MYEYVYEYGQQPIFHPRCSSDNASSQATKSIEAWYTLISSMIEQSAHSLPALVHVLVQTNLSFSASKFIVRMLKCVA